MAHSFTVTEPFTGLVLTDAKTGAKKTENAKKMEMEKKWSLTWSLWCPGSPRPKCPGLAEAGHTMPGK